MTTTDPPAYDFDRFIDGLDGAREPSLAFHPGMDFNAWRAALLERVQALLGDLPALTGAEPEILESTDCGAYVQHKLVYETIPDVLVPAWLLVPASASAEQPASGVLALHGHGDGKDQLVARDDSANIYRSFARRYAERGHVVLAPDAIGFGERAEGFRRYGQRDGCNLNFMRALLFGINLMALNIQDDRRGLDILAALPEVDAGRLGCAGLSFGGTRTMYLGALDTRIRAAVVSGYLTTFSAYALGPGNFCGSQFLPGIYAYADVPDLHGLIAPRPLLIEAGRMDRGFLIEASRQAHARLAAIYEAAGVPDRLERDEFDGGHEFRAATSLGFMDRWLAPASPATS
jgi:fermentation-respiration switch protein FrsA (DUF1100 family)